MATEPATKATELISELQRLRDAPVLDQLALRRVRAKAEKIKAIDRSQSYMLLGMAAGLESEYAEMRRRFDAALKIQPSNMDIWRNYFTSLEIAKSYTDAMELAEEAFRQNPGDMEALQLAIDGTYGCGRLDLAMKYLTRWNELSSGKTHPGTEAAREVAGFLRTHGLAEDALVPIIRVMEAPWRPQTTWGLRLEILEDEESAWLSVAGIIAVSIDEAVDANFALAEAIDDAGIDPAVLSVVTAIYESVEEAGE